ncbi:thiol:disulfide interchange protein DsbA/DsbL [Rhodanobacter sp. MP1X3]|uniref:thiol:disulfide interchange protein DsbA/DsbL n=1 Tax=Rhodanobacter sp. MP1X3 TaxID=2723086 RepID=UPI00161C944D|nr:thiol:disulfide interchange protein DsbA/DsbL [Rhodanobacter sp. MP1X3]MBB6243485.1 thiol:disulfide interchange protein DsbA [Rhodanobacter sp. MP1X3]
MLKRLPILCVALLALAACSHDSDNSAASSSTPAASTTAATTATASTTPAPASTAPAAAASAAPAANASTPATADTQPTKPAAPFVDDGKWVEGKNYFLVDPAQPTSHPGKVEVTEVFSYACPACNSFHTTMDELVKSLPSNAVVVYLPASFRPDENWPLFQRAFYAAQALGVADKTYDAMFDASWKTGELSTYDLQAGKPKPHEAWPTIDDVAKFYAKYGVDPKQFVGVANSFSINTQMKRADDELKALGVDSTPTIVVNGKYRLTPKDAGGLPQTIELVQWLVSKETAGK